MKKYELKSELIETEEELPIYEFVWQTFSQEKVNIKIPKEAGVYFLFNKDKMLTYIGQTCNLKARLAIHKSNRGDQFRYLRTQEMRELYKPQFYTYIIEKDFEKRIVLEALLINRFKPFLNLGAGGLRYDWSA